MKSKIVSILGMAILAGGLAWADPKPAGLDGTTWRVTVMPDGIAKEKGEKDFPETLTFVGDQLSTAEGPKFGFATVPYTVSRSGVKDWSFTSQQTSVSHGTYVWSGTVHGGDVRGKLVWTKSDGTVLTYSFKGNQQN